MSEKNKSLEIKEEIAFVFVSLATYGVMLAIGAIIILNSNDLPYHQTIDYLNEKLLNTVPTSKSINILLLGVGGMICLDIAMTNIFQASRAASQFFSRFFAPISGVALILLAFLSAFAEEIFFRAGLQPHIGIASTSILVAILNIIPSKHGGLYWLFLAFVNSAIYGLIYNATGNILLSMTAHCVYNVYLVIRIKYFTTTEENIYPQ